MSGKIAIEMSSPDRYRHSLELLMSKDQLEAKQKLHDAYDPALRALTAKPEMVFESGHVKIKAPIAAQANLGPYAIEMQAETPNHMSGSLKPSAINGTVEAGGRQYKYEAEIELKADVLWHPKPRGKVNEPVRVTVPKPKEDIAEFSSRNGINWNKVGKDVGNFVVKVTIATGLAIVTVAKLPQALAAQMSRISMPLVYGIDLNDPMYYQYLKRPEA